MKMWFECIFFTIWIIAHFSQHSTHLKFRALFFPVSLSIPLYSEQFFIESHISQVFFWLHSPKKILELHPPSYKIKFSDYEDTSHFLLFNLVKK